MIGGWLTEWRGVAEDERQMVNVGPPPSKDRNTAAWFSLVLRRHARGQKIKRRQYGGRKTCKNVENVKKKKYNAALFTING